MYGPGVRTLKPLWLLEIPSRFQDWRLGLFNFNYSLGFPLMKHNTMWYVIQQTQCAYEYASAMCQPFRKATIPFIVDVVLNVYICRGHIWYARYHICEDPSLSRGWICSAPLIYDHWPNPDKPVCSGRKGWDSRVAWAQCPGIKKRSAITAESVLYPGLCPKEDSSITLNVMFLGQIDQTIDYKIGYVRGVRINIVEYSRVEWKGGNNLGFSLRMKILNENAKRNVAPMGFERTTLLPVSWPKRKEKSKSAKAKIGFRAWSFSQNEDR
jgi:hypothetical protein